MDFLFHCFVDTLTIFLYVLARQEEYQAKFKTALQKPEFLHFILRRVLNKYREIRKEDVPDLDFNTVNFSLEELYIE